MAIKNAMTKKFTQDPELIKQALREPRYSDLLQANFIEEAITADGVEFRYVRKTTMTRYGRNYFVKVTAAEEGGAQVTATVQSRKVTVLWDTSWKSEAEKAFSSLDAVAALLAVEAK